MIIWRDVDPDKLDRQFRVDVEKLLTAASSTIPPNPDPDPDPRSRA